MSWFSIRLELAGTPKFPYGSPTRAYILHLPLNAAHQIDQSLLMAEPWKAVVRRFWPSQADLIGMVVSQDEENLAISYRDVPSDEAPLFRFNDHNIVPGAYLTITEPDGEALPYRIVEIAPI